MLDKFSASYSLAQLGMYFISHSLNALKNVVVDFRALYPIANGNLAIVAYQSTIVFIPFIFFKSVLLVLNLSISLILIHQIYKDLMC